ncbi:MAG: hypothetical protein KF774_06950 [Planctomyces sp.]|nr:hypothetical protein [Planctomyces sp.]
MNTFHRSAALPAVFALALSACAKSSNEISSQYISPLQYRDYSCKQIEMEMQMLSRRVSELGGHVDKTASNDSVQMGVGLILFWPTLFFLDGDTPQATEYARLKGEFEALEKVAVQKECDIAVERPQVKKAEPAEEKKAYPSQR